MSSSDPAHLATAVPDRPEAPGRGAGDPGQAGGPIDHAHRRRLAAELDQEIVEELTRIFWTDAEALASGIAECSAAGDVAGLRRHLHTLQGAASNVGYVGIVATVAEILRSKERPSVEAIDRLSAMIAHTRGLALDRDLGIATQQEILAPQR